ncbi:MAG: hypothetical protein JXA18_11940 [Chitinispirillaceae bacterium]|nr:hypothetical protein [Chitinispirillaceae bacterium]
MRLIILTIYMWVLLPTFLLVGAVSASDEEAGLTLGKFNLNGYAFWQFGQIVKGIDAEPIDHQWTNNALLGFTFSATPHERLRVVVSPEFKINYPFPEFRNKPETVRPFGVAYINEADGIFSFGNLERPVVQLALGMFTYKYNPGARHLGEYLFRTGTYPTYVFTDFDWPQARLIGLHATTKAVRNLRADLLLTSEAFMYPLYDFSLSGIASYTFFNAVDIGLGVDLARLIPVATSKTSPEITQEFRPAGYNEFIKADGDTGFYSFQATKVMARASIDPKVFFGSPDFFGKEDLKIYGEVMMVDPIEGYEEIDDTTAHAYPAYYGDLNGRILRMFGFNFPTFRLLDVLAVEFEYFPSRMPDDYFKVEQFFVPVPNVIPGEYNPDDYRGNEWKWSVYAKRNIINGFSMILLFSRDHLRTTYWNGARQSFTCMSQPDHWHWELKMGYAF